MVLLSEWFYHRVVFGLSRSSIRWMFNIDEPWKSLLTATRALERGPSHSHKGLPRSVW